MNEKQSTSPESEIKHLQDREANRNAAVELLETAKHSVEIFSRDLDPAIFDRPAILDAIKNLPLQNRKAQIRILIQDATLITKQGHRLLELARRLSTYIQLRKPGPDHLTFNEAFVIVDATAYLHRNQSDRYEAVLALNNPGRARNLLGLFNEMWEHSVPDPDLRRLHI